MKRTEAEVAQTEVDAYAKWNLEREAEDKRRRGGRGGRRRRDEDRAVDQKQLDFQLD